MKKVLMNFGNVTLYNAQMKAVRGGLLDQYDGGDMVASCTATCSVNDEITCSKGVKCDATDGRNGFCRSYNSAGTLVEEKFCTLAWPFIDYGYNDEP